MSGSEMKVLGIKSFQIADIPTGERLDLTLECDCDSVGVASIPVRAARGVTPGPTLLIVAGVHGNEYEGMEAIRRVWRSLDVASMSGALATVLIANPFAYKHRSRATPVHIDGKNLARVFPGNADGSPTERLAAALLDLVERNVGPDDLFVDLHSGTAEVAFATVVGYRDVQNRARHRSEEAARHMGLPGLWAIPDSSGPFNAETARRGIPTIGTETTGRAGCRPEDVAMYEQGLWNLLHYLDIVPGGRKPARDGQSARSTIDIASPAGGFVQEPVRLGESVTAGETIATVIDPFGAVIAEVEAPTSGEIWAAIESPVVEAGDLLFKIAAES